MSHPATAREALLAELIGDVAQLLDRVDTLMPAMDGSRQKLTEAARTVASAIQPFEAHIYTTANKAAGSAVEHIVRRTNEVAADSLEKQTRSMRDAARAIFRDEVGVALRQLEAAVKPIVDKAKRPWDTWLTHAAAALIGGASSAAVVIYLLPR